MNKYNPNQHIVDKKETETMIVNINGKEYEVSNFSHGKCNGKVYKPVRTPEEEEKAHQRLYNAAATFFIEVERQRKEKEIQEAGKTTVDSK